MQLPCKLVTLTQQINKGNRNSSINIQDQIVPLGRRHLLHLQRVREQRVLREVLVHKVLDDCHAGVRVLDGLDPVPDAHDVLVFAFHRFDKLGGAQLLVEGPGELLGGVVQCAPESGAL